MPIENEHAVVDHRRRTQIFELLVRVKCTRAELESGKVAGADEYRTINRGRRVRRLPHPERIRGRQRFAWDPIVGVVDYAFREIDKPAVLHAALIEVPLGRFELLSPVDIGVA